VIFTGLLVLLGQLQQQIILAQPQSKGRARRT